MLSGNTPLPPGLNYGGRQVIGQTRAAPLESSGVTMDRVQGLSLRLDARRVLSKRVGFLEALTLLPSNQTPAGAGTGLD